MATLRESVISLIKTTNHLAFEIGALRRELAQRGLAKTDARKKELSPGLADRVFSGGSRPQLGGSCAEESSSGRTISRDPAPAPKRRRSSRRQSSRRG